ncbi:MAG TPA: CoA transferase [Amycolatopsis sp.]|nr:CoA transferase [Amycolatopsis sp.]
MGSADFTDSDEGWCPEPGGPLAGMRVAVSGTGAAVGHAGRLLASLGAAVVSGDHSWHEVDGAIDAAGVVPSTWDGPAVRTVDTTALEDWAGSGAMALTGLRAGPALRSPGQPASAAWGALLALELLARIGGRDVVLPGPRVLAERAAVAGLRRDAPWSPSGMLRLLRAADGWIGVHLARGTGLLAQWLEMPVPAGDPWPVVEAVIAERKTWPLAERARAVELPVGLPSDVDEQLVMRGQLGGVWPFVLDGQVRRASRCDRPVPAEPRPWRLPSTLVVDLSSRWAGPLCGHLLALLGARVVKVEDLREPDAARPGPFFDLLHAGQESVALDLGTEQGRSARDALVGAADVVIANVAPPARRSAVWVSITPYGCTGPWARYAGFADDASVAGGLLAVDPETGLAAPCGDAIAAPLAGVNAALVAVACRMAGGEWFADLALREQAAATLTAGMEGTAAPEVAPPVARRPAGRAPTLGADTARVLREL